MTILEVKKRLNDIKRTRDEWLLKLNDAETIQYAKQEDRALALDLKSDIKMTDIIDIVQNLNREERKLKSALAKANQTTKCFEELTIAETLVALAQEQNLASRLHSVLPNDNKKLSMTGYAQQTYTERLYDIDEIRKIYNEKLEFISQLQLAIDIANAKTEINL